MHQSVILRNGQGMGKHRGEMLLDGMADVALGLFDGFAVAETAGDVGRVSEVPFVLRFLLDAGHELGYHSEIVDQAAIWNDEPAACLQRDLAVLTAMLGTEIVGVASHGGMTGLNNLDFWRDRRPADFGLVYEAYDREPTFNLFHESFYVSDSEWTRWKCYDNGVLRPGDQRSPAEHARDGHPVLHTLIHPDTYYRNHFYE